MKGVSNISGKIRRVKKIIGYKPTSKEEEINKKEEEDQFSNELDTSMHV